MGKKFKRVPADVPVSDLNPLNITCGSTKCDDGLHCFKTSERVAKKFGSRGVCKECGANLIDWKRVYQNNIKDAKFIFKSMKNELIRHVYWHTPIDRDAIQIALKFTREEMREHTKKVLKTKIGSSHNAWDGRQTPMTGKEIVNYAQHATATCCRKCLEYWHNIKKDDELTEEQLEFCTDLVMLYIEERVPNISNKNDEK
ncbi:MAG: DUF4186 family protein [Chitinophagaceae bacterium]|nr:DUF4186 family protein [Chitinophagaceae bacterium]